MAERKKKGQQQQQQRRKKDGKKQQKDNLAPCNSDKFLPKKAKDPVVVEERKDTVVVEERQAENDTTEKTNTIIPTVATDSAVEEKENDVASSSASEPPDLLTARLQKLALDRQTESKGDRLRVVQADQSSHLSSAKTFQEMDLPKSLLDALFAMGFDRPSEIQEEALPRMLAGRNVIGQAQSGSGKTAAFCLGMLTKIKLNSPATVQALCVTPTRELAVQIFTKTVNPMAVNLEGLKVQLALAGEMIEKGNRVEAHMVIGTPGKIVDWLKRRIIRANTIKVFVLDEADEMVSADGHRANSILIKKQLPKKCQSLFFSATFPPEVVKFADKLVSKPDKILIETGPDSLVLDIIKQLWVDTRQYDGGKLQFLADIYSLLSIGQSIVFVATKREANEVHDTLSENGFSCSLLHSRVDNADRDATMDAFRSGESSVLITTNLLARGVDVDNVCLVVNYDIPVDRKGNPDFETYLHRIGRTGRFGRKGTAISLVNDARSIEVLAAIEEHFSQKSSGDQEMIEEAPDDPEALADEVEI